MRELEAQYEKNTFKCFNTLGLRSNAMLQALDKQRNSCSNASSFKAFEKLPCQSKWNDSFEVLCSPRVFPSVFLRVWAASSASVWRDFIVLVLSSTVIPLVLSSTVVPLVLSSTVTPLVLWGSQGLVLPPWVPLYSLILSLPFLSVIEHFVKLAQTLKNTSTILEAV